MPIDLPPDEFLLPNRGQLVQVAAEIGDLCSPTANPANLKHCRERIEHCRQRERAYERWQKDADQQRHRVFLEKYATDFAEAQEDRAKPPARKRGLTNPNITPLEPCYTWVDFTDSDGCWVRLSAECDQAPLEPIPPPPPRPFRQLLAENHPRPHIPEDLLDGYYWTLAVIHDRIRGERFRIIEDDLEALVNSGTPIDQWTWPAGMALEMATFPEMIGERFTCDEIRTALREVKADLERGMQNEYRGQDVDSQPSALPSSHPGSLTEEIVLSVDIKAIRVFVVVDKQRREVDAFRNGRLPWKLFCQCLMAESFTTQDVLWCLTKQDDEDPGETLEDGTRPEQRKERTRQQNKVRRFLSSVRNTIRKAGDLAPAFDPFPHDKKTNAYRLSIPVITQ